MSVEVLQSETSVSPATIRRDLQLLEEQGHIERFHGGAKLSRKNHFELSFEKRALLKVKQKKYIAAIAAKLIEANDTILLGAGTTTLYIARALAQQEKPVSIITNNFIVAHEAANYPNLKLNLLGGNLDYANMESVGPSAVENLSKHIVDKAFIGVNALEPQFGGSSIYEENAYLYRAMVEVSRNVFVVADSSKFKSKATHIAVPIGQLSHLITDSQADSHVVAAFRTKGTRVYGA